MAVALDSVVSEAMKLSVDELVQKMNSLEKKYNKQFKVIFEAIRQLMTPSNPPKRPIGFHVKE